MSPKHDCPVCGRRTLDERGAYDICAKCGWEDDGEDRGWVPSGPNGGETLWSARLRQAGHAAPEVAAELERLRAEEVERVLPAYLRELSQVLRAPIDRRRLIAPGEADRLSLRLHNGPMPGPHDRVELADVAAVERELARVDARPPPAALLDIGNDALLGALRVDPAVVLERWRPLLEQRFMIELCSPDLSGGLVLRSMGEGFELSTSGRFVPR